MYKIVSKKTNDYIEGIGFLEEVFEKIADKQNKNLVFEIKDTSIKNKINIEIKINTTNGKR